MNDILLFSLTMIHAMGVALFFMASIGTYQEESPKWDIYRKVVEIEFRVFLVLVWEIGLIVYGVYLLLKRKKNKT